MTAKIPSFYFLTDDDFMSKVRWLMAFFDHVSQMSFADVKFVPPPGSSPGEQPDLLKLLNKSLENFDAGSLIEQMVVNESYRGTFSYKEWVKKRLTSHTLTDFVQDNAAYSYDKNKYDFIKAIYNCFKIYEESVFKQFIPATSGMGWSNSQ